MIPIAVGILLLLSVSVVRYYLKNRGLPPGPARLPFIGNIHQLPEQNPWRTYQEWSKKYGPVFSLRVGLDTIVMLNNHEAARDLLDKRSNIYSSRPRLVMGGECVSKGLRTLLMPYGPRWRTHQRLQASFLNIRISQSYTGLQDTESKQLMHELLHTDDFSSSFHRYASSLIYALAYGKRLETANLPEAQEVEQIMEGFLYAARVGTWMVDAIPALNMLPSWMAPWKVRGEELHQYEARIMSKNLEKGKVASGWNWTKQVLSMKESKEMSPLELAYDVGIIYEAGSDTTTMALEVFTMAAITHPDFITKAQQELDAFVGDARLPNYSDKSNLPYIGAIVNEVLRWRPVTAGGIPHALIQDDEYMGYRIPKGATVIGNHWAIHLDEDIYKDALTFEPDRWIENPDLPLSPFGFGRRVCTGQHIAKNSLFLNIARMLWAFDIGHASIGGVRQEIDEWAMTQGFNSRPMPFKASFKVRSDGRREVIEKEWQSVEKDVAVILNEIRPSSD
jgi:cytochrome P450